MGSTGTAADRPMTAPFQLEIIGATQVLGPCKR
jgi:hypothetical protein